MIGAALAGLALVVGHDDLSGTTFQSARLDLIWSAVLLALLGGAVYWWPKLTGRVLDGRLTNVSAYVITGSSLLLALGRALAGWNDQPALAGVTIDDAGTGSLLGTIGVFGIGAGIVLFGLAKLRGRSGRRVGNDPWRRRHARVVHDLAAAAAQLRLAAAGHERPTARRPAHEAERAQCALT